MFAKDMAILYFAAHQSQFSQHKGKYMNYKHTLASLLVGACLSVTAMAQEDVQPYIYATYYHCDTTKQERADELVDSVWKPIYDDAVENESIVAWGWLAHHTGGTWRRILYFSAPTIDELLASQESIGDAIDEATGDSTEFGDICNSHDDYIWQSVTGSGGAVVGAPRGEVGLSAYHVCRMADEDRADELVKTVIGPVFDAHTGDGKLSSWGWSQHIVGGKYRRLATMTAKDWPTLFAMRGAIFEALDGNVLGDEFNEICGSHSDYLWDIQHEKP
jgi:hypothetical protein